MWTQGQTEFGNLMAKAWECGPPLMIGSRAKCIANRYHLSPCPLVILLFTHYLLINSPSLVILVDNMWTYPYFSSHAAHKIKIKYKVGKLGSSPMMKELQLISNFELIIVNTYNEQINVQYVHSSTNRVLGRCYVWLFFSFYELICSSLVFLFISFLTCIVNSSLLLHEPITFELDYNLG